MKSAASFLENVKKGLNIGLVFGESREVGSKTIIPVAHFSYGMGHGEGKSKPGHKFMKESAGDHHLPENRDELNVSEKTEKDTWEKGEFGQGFGGGFKAKPVGIFQITEDKTIFLPVISAKQLIFIGMTIFWMLKRKKRRRK